MTVVHTPSGFFQTIRALVPLAENAADNITELSHTIADKRLRLRFIGSGLIPIITPALAHLRTEPDATGPDLTIHCWDCASLGIAFPEAPVAKSAFTPRGEIPKLCGGGFAAAFEPFGRSLACIDTECREAVYCVGNSADIPRFEFAEPIRGLLSWFMRAHGRQLLHAAAVGKPDGGVLLIGRSGAGKSNTALGCLGSDLLYVADDFCIVLPGEKPMVYSIYNTGKTRVEDWERLPFLANLAPDRDPTGKDKAIYFLKKSMPQSLISDFPLKAILLPCRGGERCAVRPLSGSAVVRLNAPDTARVLPDAGVEVLRSIASLSRAVPCFALDLGPRPQDIPPTISRLLTELSAPRVKKESSA